MPKVKHVSMSSNCKSWAVMYAYK